MLGGIWVTEYRITRSTQSYGAIGAGRSGAPVPVVGHQADQVGGLADRGVVLRLVPGVVSGVVLLDVHRDVQELVDRVQGFAEFGDEGGERRPVLGGQILVVDLDAVESVAC